VQVAGKLAEQVEDLADERVEEDLEDHTLLGGLVREPVQPLRAAELLTEQLRVLAVGVDAVAAGEVAGGAGGAGELAAQLSDRAATGASKPAELLMLSHR